jgi:hypothetical protein
MPCISFSDLESDIIQKFYISCSIGKYDKIKDANKYKLYENWYNSMYKKGHNKYRSEIIRLGIEEGLVDYTSNTLTEFDKLCSDGYYNSFDKKYINELRLKIKNTISKDKKIEEDIEYIKKEMYIGVYNLYYEIGGYGYFKRVNENYIIPDVDFSIYNDKITGIDYVKKYGLATKVISEFISSEKDVK